MWDQCAHAHTPPVGEEACKDMGGGEEAYKDLGGREEAYKDLGGGG